ncbi:MAG: dihydroorotate dehydrogenase electron transfer subunit [Deltaproteobacteria bacterium]|nr:dihydroorotate dehydrogenase electron transfer subunit [Deltaproteobacteria bacterium]
MKTYPKEVKARILIHRRIAADYFRLRLLCPEIARFAQPGQFIMLRVNELRDPFLRRPFGFSRIFPPQEKRARPEDEGVLEICYQIVGRGTSLMTQLREGQRLDILGPLGNGFWAKEGQKGAILVGGGIGIAPLISWAEKLHKVGGKKKRLTRNSEEAPEVFVLIGGKSRDKILGIREIKKMGLDPQVATEDGSMGLPGLATDLLERELLTKGHDSTSLYACGPMPMLARVAQIADQFDLPCQVLMETRMACGVGACLGCALKVKERAFREMAQIGVSRPEEEKEEMIAESQWGKMEKENQKEIFIPVIAEAPTFRYALACKEGPVFEARDILWE